MLVKNPYVNFILKGQGIFFIRHKQNYPITSHAKLALCKECNQIPYSFFRIFAERQESHASQINRVFLKRGLQPHCGSYLELFCFLSFISFVLRKLT